MESPARLVEQFHRALGFDVAERPGVVADERAAVRQRMLDEECAEVADAVDRRDLAAVAHELADVVYVAYGTALAYGIPLDRVIAEVHRANMTKDRAGADGKAHKGPGFRPPDVAGVLEGHP